MFSRLTAEVRGGDDVSTQRVQHIYIMKEQPKTGQSSSSVTQSSSYRAKGACLRYYYELPVPVVRKSSPSMTQASASPLLDPLTPNLQPRIALAPDLRSGWIDAVSATYVSLVPIVLPLHVLCVRVCGCQLCRRIIGLPIWSTVLPSTALGS